ncbi:TKL/IRAK protein kinase [Capsaspora owczarzaki ATCC 30864]|uniref:TKL/IRAK protein kinase n=1 Tax=Capsaspora owczarzaki (strain ATCC 30864) TaxID=595528 RepID=A0A0D2VKY4_CAPO3|nr:TKL/IRAK protein kinase [Capsaspora owczarzaki ATCC 30864]
MTERQRELYDRVKNASGKLNLTNELGDEEALAIAEALKVNTTLTSLILDCNQIGDVGAQAIAEALKVNTTLTWVTIWQNHIGDAGAQAIAEALKVNTTLTWLSLDTNAIGDAGARAIAEAIKVNKALTRLHLSKNQLGDAGAQAFAEALKVNKTLAELDLSENFFTTSGINALKQTGNAICKLIKLNSQRVRSPAELTQIAAATEIQQLRSEVASKDRRIAFLEQNIPNAPIPRVPLATLVSATNNFAGDTLLGEGAFGPVYDARLPSGQRVAIKRLSAKSIQGYTEFKAELDTLSKFRHPNIITILSYAESHGEYCLVYEFMPNGSVRDRLNRKNDTPPLTWSQRHRIAADVARGMHYVQTAFPDHVLFHLDLKTDNVLLDAHFSAKVSDFGLVRAATHLDVKNYIRTQNVRGTVSYMCPQLLESGRMTTKTDVYAFGMILLELVTAANPGTRLKSIARRAVDGETTIELLDSALDRNAVERQSVSNIVTLALECLDDEAADRPSFGSIIVQLDPWSSDMQSTATKAASHVAEKLISSGRQELQVTASQLSIESTQLSRIVTTIPSIATTIPRVSLQVLSQATAQFSESRRIGGGGFGSVYSGVWSGQRVAVKRLAADSMQGVAQFESELEAHARFRHPNIVTIMCYAQEGNERCLVYELMTNGSVRDRLDRKGGMVALSWQQRRTIATDIANAMHFVQTAIPRQPLFHLDLKTDNVLLAADFHAKVADFGLTRSMPAQVDVHSYIKTKTIAGSYKYICPQYHQEGKVSIKTDVYSYGMILLELLTGKQPGIELGSAVKRALKNHGRLDSELDTSVVWGVPESVFATALAHLALACLEFDGVDRPSFGEILKRLSGAETGLNEERTIDDARMTAFSQTDLAAKIQQLRSELAAKDQELAAKNEELQQLRSSLVVKELKHAVQGQELQHFRSNRAATDQGLQRQLGSDLPVKSQRRAPKNHDSKSAFDRIDVLKRHQPGSNLAKPIPQVSLAALVTATNNFVDDSLIGKGKFGRVYGASLSGQHVAIKRLSAETIQGYIVFQSELHSLSQFRHPNIIALLSHAESHDEYCLVFEFMPNGSVRDRLNLKNSTPPLTWSQRHGIAVGVASGMHYIQTAFSPGHVLLHLNLKTDNVLLDAKFNAKVSDFGLVRAASLDEKSDLRTQSIQGTVPYMSPEFFDEGLMTTKTDVYAFGMILLELMTAAKPRPRLKSEARHAIKYQTVNELLDSAFKPTEVELQSAVKLVALALECLDEAADDRPSFRALIATLVTR